MFVFDFPLNEEQTAAVNAVKGIFVTVAGPGSGKTTILTQRFKNMLMQGISDRDILNLTFTAAAAEEMIRRVGLFDADKVFRTFHSFALDFAKKERENFPFPLCDTVIPVRGEDYKLLFDLCRGFGIWDYEDLKSQISAWKRTNISPEQAMIEAEKIRYKRGKKRQVSLVALANAYSNYEALCREQGWLDFDSLMQETVSLLESNATVRARHQRKYIAVDEAQDTDIIQYKLLQLLYGGNIFVVGDENQLIYEWRSAQPGNLTNFERVFPGAQKLYLGENFRSTGALVEFFKEILPLDNGIASHMVTKNEYGTRPSFVRFYDDFTEAHWVLEHISNPAQSVVIARTNRQLFAFQRICAAKGIKYNFLGKKDFWDQKEIKTALGHAKEKVEDPRPAHEVLAEIIESHELVEYFTDRIDDDADPVNNLNGLVKIAAGKGTIKEFLSYVRKLTHARRDVRKVKTLTLSTVHQAKGREWDHVFVIGANQGKMPHMEGDPAEEKRIFFVACTRASKTLHITFNEKASEFITRPQEIRVYTGLEEDDDAEIQSVEG
jgi:DNA helicase II / ATP-dependent DNA helicase PcrA